MLFPRLDPPAELEPGVLVGPKLHEARFDGAAAAIAHKASRSASGTLSELPWQPERIFFGFFQHSKFTALAVPKADGFNGSHDVHMHMHMHVHTRAHKDAAAARKDGLLTMYS